MKLSPLRSAIIIACLSLGLFFFQERIEVPLWDGVLYTALAKSPWEQIAEGVTPYQIQRILPSLLVHGLLWIGKIPLNDANIISGFAFLHVIQFSLIAYFLTKSLEILKLDAHGKALGLVLCFGSYFAMKAAFVYPCLTDCTAFLLGTVMTYCYLSQNFWGLFAVTAAGIFSWPLTIYYAVPLFLFGKHELKDNGSILRLRPPRSWLGPILIAAVFVSLPLVYSAPFQWFTEQFPAQALFASFEYLTPLLNLSILIAVIYLGAAFFLLLNNRCLLTPSQWFGKQARLRSFLLLGILFLSQVPKFLGIEEGYGHHVSHGQFLYLLGIFPIVKPAIFLVAHTAYLGVVSAFAVFLWPEVSKRIRRQGMGLVVAASFSIILSLNPESRQLSLSLPFLLPFITAAAADKIKGRAPLLAISLLALLQSRFWLATTEWDPFQNAWVLAQRIHLSAIGPWMGNKDWFVHGLVGAVTWTLVYLLCFKTRPRKGYVQEHQERPESA